MDKAFAASNHHDIQHHELMAFTLEMLRHAAEMAEFTGDVKPRPELHVLYQQAICISKQFESVSSAAGCRMPSW